MIDVDAAKAARREALAIKPSVKIDGKEYELPVELSITSLDLLDSLGSKNDFALIDKILPLLFGKNAKEVRDAVSVQDFFMIVAGLLAEYGISRPNGQPSAKSSGTTGQKPRGRSKKNSTSTSETPATEQKLSA